MWFAFDPVIFSAQTSKKVVNITEIEKLQESLNDTVRKNEAGNL